MTPEPQLWIPILFLALLAGCGNQAEPDAKPSQEMVAQRAQLIRDLDIKQTSDDSFFEKLTKEQALKILDACEKEAMARALRDNRSPYPFYVVDQSMADLYQQGSAVTPKKQRAEYFIKQRSKHVTRGWLDTRFTVLVTTDSFGPFRTLVDYDCRYNEKFEVAVRPKPSRIPGG